MCVVGGYDSSVQIGGAVAGAGDCVVAGTHILYAQQQLHKVNRVVPVCAERIDPVPEGSSMFVI